MVMVLSAMILTLVELLVVIAIIGMLIALLLPAVQAAREAARRMQCSNKLRKIGLAIHNFHDTSNGIPPIAIARGGTTWVVTILPFIEMNSIYDSMVNRDRKFANTLETAGANGWWKNTTHVSDKGQMAAAFGGFHCPTRGRGGQTRMAVSYASTNNVDDGPVTDYNAPILRIDDVSTFDTDSGLPSGGWTLGTNISSYHYSSVGQYFVGPLRTSVIPWNDRNTADGGSGSTRNVANAVDAVNAWQPRDNFAYWSDGTSNQLVIGEKHVPFVHLGVCEGNSGSNLYSHQNSDCGFLSTDPGAQREFGAARTIRHDLKTDPKWGENIRFTNATTNSRNGYGFGSYHTGVVNFLVGDGAVRAFSVTTNPDRVLVPLTRVNDGRAVSVE